MSYGFVGCRTRVQKGPLPAVHSGVIPTFGMIPHRRGAPLMLAAAAPTVKLAPNTTPEQQGGTENIDQALTLFWTLVQRLQTAADQEQPIHRVEEIIFR